MILTKSRRWVGALGLFALCATARRSFAFESTSVVFSWNAPEGCPDEAAIVSEAERILQQPLRNDGSRRLRVNAAVRTPDQAGTWQVRLQTESSQSSEGASSTATRSIDAASCTELASATALLLAILIRPDIAETHGALAPQPSSFGAAPPASGAPPPTLALASPAHAEISLMGGPVLGLHAGYLPSASPGIGVGGAFGWRTLWIDAAAFAWLPSEKKVAADPEQGARFNLYTASADLCVGLPSRNFLLGPCAGVEFAAMRGEGFGDGVKKQADTALSLP